MTTPRSNDTIGPQLKQGIATRDALDTWRAFNRMHLALHPHPDHRFADVSKAWVVSFLARLHAGYQDNLDFDTDGNRLTIQATPGGKLQAFISITIANTDPHIAARLRRMHLPVNEVIDLVSRPEEHVRIAKMISRKHHTKFFIPLIVIFAALLIVTLLLASTPIWFLPIAVGLPIEIITAVRWYGKRVYPTIKRQIVQNMELYVGDIPVSETL
jgi:hypothetical protein